MRLAEADIVAGLGHSSLHVREVVAEYLDDCGRTQTDITRHLIAAVERFGWDEVLEFPNRVANFDLDAATLEWVLGEMRRTGPGAPSDNIRWHLSRMVADAPIAVVRPALEFILQLDVFHESRNKLSRQPWTNADQLKLRDGLFDKTPEECWELLDRHCREVAEVDEIGDEAAYRATALVERIATSGAAFADRARTVLEREDASNGYEEWQTGVMIELAGALQLETAAELVFRHFEKDWDWYNEAIQKALVRMGTPAVAALVRERYAESPWHVRLYSSGVLEAVHHDGSVADTLQVVPHEDDEGLRGQLGVALASHFDELGIEPALEIYREDRKDAERFEIVERLFAHASLANIERPEMGEWEELIQARWQEFQVKRGEIEGLVGAMLTNSDWDDNDNLTFADDQWSDAASTMPPTYDEDAYLPKPQPIVRTAPRVGRNELCPCGSGKKFKHCCLRNSAM